MDAHAVWTADPSVLYQGSLSTDPCSGDAVARANAAARLVILVTVVAYVATRRLGVVLAGAGALVALALYQGRVATEGMVGQGTGDGNTDPGFEGVPRASAVTGIGFAGMQSANDIERAGMVFGSPTPHAPAPPEPGTALKLQVPTDNNPLMNVLLSEYTTDPDRAPAAPAFDPVVKEEIAVASDTSDRRLYQDLGDEIDQEVMLRQFYATANTQIPNAQGAFAEWVGRPWPGASDASGRSTFADVGAVAAYVGPPAQALDVGAGATQYGDATSATEWTTGQAQRSTGDATSATEWTTGQG